MHTFVPSGRTVKEPVIVNVYDLVPLNALIFPVGLGFYHSGVVVYGQEYTFGGGDTSGTGVFGHEPTKLPPPLRISLTIGTTSLTSKQVADVVARLSEEFAARSYHIVARNCNVFSDTLARELCGTGIPKYINRVAYIASFAPCLFPSVPPLITHAPPTKSSTAVFGGSGRALDSGTSPNSGELSSPHPPPQSNDAELRRRRMRQAAERRMSSVEEERAGSN